MTQFKKPFGYFLKRLLLLSLILSHIALAEQRATLIFDAEMPVINDAEQGQYAQLASVIDQYRKKDTNTFFIFGGESLGPSMLSSMDRGAHIIDLLNSLNPSAMGVSKRELSYQEDELILRTYEAAFPIVSSNLYDPLTHRPPDGIHTFAILKNANVSLGFISVLAPEVIEKYPTNRVEVTSAEKAIIKAVIELKSRGVDLIVLHYSMYLPIFDQLLENGIVDLTLYKDQYFSLNPFYGAAHHPRNVIIENSTHAVAVHLTWQEDPLKRNLVITKDDIDVTVYPPKASVLQQEKEYAQRINSLLEEVLGTTETPIDLRRKPLRNAENGFASLVADTLREFTDAQISLVNSGTIRSDTGFSKGTLLTRRDIRTILPYRNTIKLIEANGQQITDALEYGLSGLGSESGQYLQISGIKIQYDSTRDIGHRLLSVTFNNKPLNPTKSYRVATLDYLLMGGDGYTMFKDNIELDYHQTSNFTLYDIMANAVLQQKVISPKTDGRIIDKATTQ